MLRLPTLAYNKIMPAKNAIKEYLEGGVYHVYNRGINKQDIFLDEKDYATFLYYLKMYLDNPENLDKSDLYKKNRTARKSFYKQIDLLCYCLMPNHFHLILKQRGERDISEFMRSLIINYSMYFNSIHKRVGPLFQGAYKAVLIKNDNYLLHLSRYIHVNPLAKVGNLSKVIDYPYSSYANYLGKKDTKWVKPGFILDYFEDNKGEDIIAQDSYKDFVEEYEYDSKDIIGDLILE